MTDLNNKKILIIRLSAIGDTIHSLPVLGAIKEAFPQAKVSWLVEKESAFLLQNNPLLDKVFIFEKDYLKNQVISIKSINHFKCLISSLKKENFDIAIDIQGLFKSGLLTYLSDAKRKIGFKHTREFAEYFLNERVDIGKVFDNNEHVIEKNLKLAEYLCVKGYKLSYPLPDTPEEVKNKVTLLLENINPELKTVVIIPSTTWQSKLWNKVYWKEIIEYLSDKVNIILTGTKADQSLNNEITFNIDNKSFINLAEKTSLLDLIEIFSRSDIVLGVDTGPIHLAVATEKPKVIAISGPTSAIRNGAYKHINLHTSLQCQPCHKKFCILDGKDYMKCMNNLKPEEVINVINQLIY
ncbi:MAG: glycosyltransferase family 9 protein [Cyanobacteriota bacterium]